MEIKKFETKQDDIFLLCSDGFYDNLSNNIIKSGMETSVLENGMEYMSTKVLSGVADDNLTATLIKVK